MARSRRKFSPRFKAEAMRFVIETRRLIAEKVAVDRSAERGSAKRVVKTETPVAMSPPSRKLKRAPAELVPSARSSPVKPEISGLLVSRVKKVAGFRARESWVSRG
mgnify:CR=1 FL=1